MKSYNIDIYLFSLPLLLGILLNSNTAIISLTSVDFDLAGYRSNSRQSLLVLEWHLRIRGQSGLEGAFKII